MSVRRSDLRADPHPPFLVSSPADDDDDTPTGDFTCDGVQKGDYCCSVSPKCAYVCLDYIDPNVSQRRVIDDCAIKQVLDSMYIA